jgi:hypothetical protein
MAPSVAPKPGTKMTLLATTPLATAPAKHTVPLGVEVIQISDYPTPFVSSGKKKGEHKRTAATPARQSTSTRSRCGRRNRRSVLTRTSASSRPIPLAVDKAPPVVVPAASADDFLPMTLWFLPSAARYGFRRGIFHSPL